MRLERTWQPYATISEVLAVVTGPLKAELLPPQPFHGRFQRAGAFLNACTNPLTVG